MVLLRGLLGQVVRKGTLTLIAPDGGVYRTGTGGPLITIRIVDPRIIPKLLF